MNMIIYFKETGDDFWLNERTSDISTINSNFGEKQQTWEFIKREQGRNAKSVREHLGTCVPPKKPT